MTSGKLIDRITLLNITIFVEASILLAATFWSYLGEIKLMPALVARSEDLLIGASCGVALALTSLLLFFLGRHAAWLSHLREFIVEQVAPLFSDLRLPDLMLVAAISGFCEEVLFRGVMQHELGLVGTSLIFGVFHCPSLRHISYGLWAFGAGLFLGILYIWTHSLWVPIMAHAVSNCISLLFLRYGIKAPPAEQEK